MTIIDLQNALKVRGFYNGACDGNYGPATRAALLACLSSGPDTPLAPADVQSAANFLGTTPAHIRTVQSVEAAGAGFANGLPKILFEGHIFSKLTGHKYDATHPAISYPKWDKTKYPKTQTGRYDQLLDAAALDPDAAFSAASYGAFQILGSNFKVCGFNSPFEFVLAQCTTEGAQLMAFVKFVKGNNLDAALRENRWADFARGYNGSAYAANAYDVKLAKAFGREQALDAAAKLNPPLVIAPKPVAPVVVPMPAPPVPTPVVQPSTANALITFFTWLFDLFGIRKKPARS